jgi:hypothetical protein
MPHSDGFSTLVPLDGLFAVCRLAAHTPQPAWAAEALAGAFLSITSTAEELSIVAPEGAVPDGVRGESGWRCFRVAGTLDFALTGVLSALLVPLADAGIAVFVVSTFDTDYLLVKDDRWGEAIEVLKRQGYHIASA